MSQAQETKTADYPTQVSADFVNHMRVRYLMALEAVAAGFENEKGSEASRAIRWELRAFKKLVLIRLPGGRAPLNGHKWKAPKI